MASRTKVIAYSGVVAAAYFLPTFASVLVSELVLLIVGYVVIWRNYGILLLRQWQ